MLAGVNSRHIPLYFLLKAPLNRWEIAVDLDKEEILPRFRLLVLGLRHPKQQTGIRLKIACPQTCLTLPNPLSYLHRDFPLQFPFSVHVGQPYGRNTFRQKMGSNQDVSNSNGMLEKIGVVAFVRFF